MEAPNPQTASPLKIKEFPLLIGKDNYTLTISCSYDAIRFSLFHKNESLKYEKSFGLNELSSVSKWFKIFDSLDEVFEDIIKLMGNNQLNVNLEENVSKLVFNINMEKIKTFEILLDKKELSKDEMIKNLIQENKELKDRVINLEKRLSSLEERFNNLERNNGKTKGNIINEKNELLKSDIINDEDKKTLNNWINLNNDKKIILLYKASRDGDNYQDFYRLCENKGPTITIALTTKGYKFGGYTSLSWKNPHNGANQNKYFEDKDAFIFSLNKKRKYYPKIENKNHVCMWSDRGPSFGNGNDLTLHNNCLHNNNSYNNCPYTYQTEINEINGGENYFTVKDYEVYSIN